MVRGFKKKTNRGETPVDVMMRAVRQVKLQHQSVRKTARDFNINYKTLSRYCAKVTNAQLQDSTVVALQHVGYIRNRQILPTEMETELASYLLKKADIFYGMSSKEIRSLAYQMAVSKNIIIPKNWKETKAAGPDWFTAFMSRHQDLSERLPDVTILGKATGFNRVNVNKFYDNLLTVWNRYKFTAQDLWNMDEIGVTATEVPDKVVTRKGYKKIGSHISHEKGTLVTFAVSISATGNTLPPFFVFPCANFQDHFLNNGPVGSKGAANESSWMHEKEFNQFLIHFVHNVKCTKDRPALLVVDYPSLYLNIVGLNYAEENGVIMISFPPHCSHKLQPLNRTVFGPFKKAINIACFSWKTQNPEKTISIYDIPVIINTAYPNAMTSENIRSGFCTSGIFPFNGEIFSDFEFAPRTVTDQFLSPYVMSHTETIDSDILQPNIILDSSGTHDSTPVEMTKSNQSSILEGIPGSSRVGELDQKDIDTNLSLKNHHSTLCGLPKTFNTFTHR